MSFSNERTQNIFLGDGKTPPQIPPCLMREAFKWHHDSECILTAKILATLMKLKCFKSHSLAKR